MKKNLTILLRFQVLIALMTVLITAIFMHPYWRAVLAGTTVSILATFAVKLILRRMPEVVRPKAFYSAMIVCESVKWLAVIVLTSLYLKMNYAALGILIGVSTTYILSYAALWLKK